MKTLQIIGAYAGAQEAFDRHLPFWKHCNADVLVTSPADSPIITDQPQLLEGRKGHHGTAGLYRYLFLLEWLRNTKYDRFVFHDYDSFNLEQEYPEPTSPVSGPCFSDLRPDRPFIGSLYIHPPIMITAQGLELIHQRKGAIGDSIEGGFFDRWLGYLCQAAGILVTDWYPKGICFTRNSFDRPEILAEAVKAIENGAYMIHGVKTAEGFNRVLDANDRRIEAKHFAKQR